MILNSFINYSFSHHFCYGVTAENLTNLLFSKGAEQLFVMLSKFLYPPLLPIFSILSGKTIMSPRKDSVKFEQIFGIFKCLS